MVGSMLDAAGSAASLDDLFLRLEDAGIMLRIDRSVTPTMAKTPTLATWELDLLRSIENVVRLGRLTSVSRGRLELSGGLGLDRRRRAGRELCRRRPQEPAARPPLAAPGITLQPIRAGFPCFGAALAGYVEATRTDDDTKNALCRPSPYAQLPDAVGPDERLGFQNTAAFNSEPDIKDWANRVTLNPARVPPESAGSTQLDGVLERVQAHATPGLARLAELMV